MSKTSRTPKFTTQSLFVPYYEPKFEKSKIPGLYYYLVKTGDFTRSRFKTISASGSH